MPWTGKLEKPGFEAQRQYPEAISKQQIAEEIPLSWRADSEWQNKVFPKQPRNDPWTHTRYNIQPCLVERDAKPSNLCEFLLKFYIYCMLYS
jgi:hypothetical protein